jgi:hypothetical protein
MIEPDEKLIVLASEESSHKARPGSDDGAGTSEGIEMVVAYGCPTGNDD